MKFKIRFIVFTIILSFFTTNVYAEQKMMKGKKILIQYNNIRDLITFSKNMNIGMEILPIMIDDMVNITQGILGMYKLPSAIKIRIYPNKFGVNAAWKRINKKKKSPIAFYYHKARTIHLSCQSIRVGVLAHEMTHSVIRDYFRKKIPKKTTEILAKYVERKMKSYMLYLKYSKERW